MRRLMGLIMLLMVLAACGTPDKNPDPTATSPPAPPAPTLTPEELVGRAVQGSGGTVYWVTEERHLRHIADWATYLALGIGEVVHVSDEMLARLPLDPPLTRWLTSDDDPALYFIYNEQRFHIPDKEALALTGGNLHDVMRVDHTLLQAYPIGEGLLDAPESYAAPPPAIMDAFWQDDLLWIVDQDGHAWTWDGNTWQDSLDVPSSFANGKLSVTIDGAPWHADGDLYDLDSATFHIGQDLVGPDGPISGPTALAGTTVLLHDPTANILWVGTHYGGLLRYDVNANAWQTFTRFDSALPDNTITALALDSQGALWVGTPAGLARYENGSFEAQSTLGVLALDVDPVGTVWYAGQDHIGQVSGLAFDAHDHPLFLDRFEMIALDAAGNPWFVGRQRVVYFDGTTWIALDYTDGNARLFDPAAPLLDPLLAFPSPTLDYEVWLRTWPRPINDNGRCMHYLQYPAGDSFEVWLQIKRLEQLGARWVLVNYTSPAQLHLIAPIFNRAGIMVIWRPFVRPYETYAHWAEDVRFLRALGVPPYMQIYNEPSLGAEWPEGAVDQAVYLQNLVPAVREVYDAGGFVGLQHIDPEWTQASIDALREADLDMVFERLFFVPHPYGFNHPPDYTETRDGVLGFRAFAQEFDTALGYVPPMIAGEGGWRPGEQQDANYPAISEQLHRDYHVAVFEWFRSGELSDGTPLPDYLFAFCPWLISDRTDPAAWWDSAAGDRELTIEAVSELTSSESQK